MAINMSYSAQEENYMNIIRSVIKKASVLGNLFYDQKQVAKTWMVLVCSLTILG